MDDGDAAIIYSLANNPNTPIDLLDRICSIDNEQKDYLVFYRHVARNVNAPDYLLKKIANYPDSETRCNVANNKNTPVSVLKKLASDKDQSVRQAVASNPNTPEAIRKNI